MLTPVAEVLKEHVKTFGEPLRKRLLINDIAEQWELLVDKSIFANVQPISIEHEVLFVDVRNSAFRDQLKFYAEEIVDAINEKFSDEDDNPIVKEIRIAQPFQIAAFKEQNQQNSAAEKSPQVNETKEQPEEITLTDEEIARCEAVVQKIEDESIRAIALKGLLSQAKFQKFKLAHGWHKCQNCDSLCPETETFCEVCRLKEHEKRQRLLFDIFCETPWLGSEEVQKIFNEKYPNLRGQCPIDFINSTRATLIQQIAGHLTIEDANSDEYSSQVSLLVMLERQLKPDKLTRAVVHRTLSELHFNLADPLRFQNYRFSKFKNLRRK